MAAAFAAGWPAARVGLDRGMIGLWVGTSSDGDFSNLRITAAE